MEAPSAMVSAVGTVVESVVVLVVGMVVESVVVLVVETAFASVSESAAGLVAASHSCSR